MIGDMDRLESTEPSICPAVDHPHPEAEIALNVVRWYLRVAVTGHVSHQDSQSNLERFGRDLDETKLQGTLESRGID
jgi:hypothetical protein